MVLLKTLILVILIAVVSCMQSHPYGQQISIQISNDKSIIFNELEKILLHPEVRHRKVALVSIIGTYRTGKSFFLDYCLRFLYANYRSINRTNFTKKLNWIGEPNEPLTGFSWKSGWKGDTKGILLWNDVFLHEKNEEKIAIMLMDTQGFYELGYEKLDYAKIFGISSFLSSVQILNLHGVMQENDLEYLNHFIEFTKIALNRQYEKSFSSSSKPFQELLLLFRDWGFDDLRFGYEDGDKYLKSIFTSESGIEDVQAIRNNIKNTYEKIDAFLMPHPGQIGSNKYDGSLKELQHDFVKYLKIIIEGLLSPEKLVVKKIFDKEVTGKDLLEYTTSIVQAFQSPELPEIEMNNLSETVYEKYKSNILKCTYFEDKNFVERLFNDHEKYQKAAVNEFERMPKMGDRVLENKFKGSIINKTDKFFLSWKVQAMGKHVDKIDKLNTEKMIFKHNEALKELLKEQ